MDESYEGSCILNLYHAYLGSTQSITLYFKCNASRNFLLFRSKPISFRGIMLSQLDEPFPCDNSIALRNKGDTVSKRFFDFCLMFI